MARQSRRRASRFLSSVSLALLLTACGASGLRFGSTPEGLIGGVVADEPRAALIGRDTLNSGGTAADAAVATYLALSVTMPTTAGLGGGGVCLYYEPNSGKTEAIDFLPRSTSGGNMAIPSNLRGMALLQARHGVMRWELLISPAESMARFGSPVSRALAEELSDPAAIGRLEAGVRRQFSTISGNGLSEGAVLKQPQLATVLARLRVAGPGDMFMGQMARVLVAASEAAGGDLTYDDLLGDAPRVVQPLDVPIGNHDLLVPPPPGTGGAVAADLMALLNEGNYEGAPQSEKPHILVEAIRRAVSAEAARIAGEPGEIGTPNAAKMLMSDFQPHHAEDGQRIDLPEAVSAASTSFVALDHSGTAVACAVTLGPRFGTGIQARSTGIFLAPPPPAAGYMSLVPALVINTKNQRTIAVVGASGSDNIPAAAPVAAIETIVNTLQGGLSLEDGITRPRLDHEGGSVLLEIDAGDSAAALKEDGHTISQIEKIGKVNAIVCRYGVPEGPGGGCEIRADPRNAGLAAGF
jgi:gamma-glutamyltranspeptidase/glutathione hydrolase